MYTPTFVRDRRRRSRLVKGVLVLPFVRRTNMAQQQTSETPKRPYQQPQLEEWGTVADLTSNEVLGGSGGAPKPK